MYILGDLSLLPIITLGIYEVAIHIIDYSGIDTITIYVFFLLIMFVLISADNINYGIGKDWLLLTLSLLCINGKFCNKFAIYAEMCIALGLVLKEIRTRNGASSPPSYNARIFPEAKNHKRWQHKMTYGIVYAIITDEELFHMHQR